MINTGITGIRSRDITKIINTEINVVITNKYNGNRSLYLRIVIINPKTDNGKIKPKEITPYFKIKE